MTGLENTKLTFTGNEMNNDHQWIDVFRIYPTMVITFYAYHIQEFGLEGKVMRCPWNKPVFMPLLTFLGKLSGMRNRFLYDLEGKMSYPCHSPIEPHWKKKWDFLVVSLQYIEEWVPTGMKKYLPTFFELCHLEQILVTFWLKSVRHGLSRGKNTVFAWSMRERWLKCSTVITVSENDGMGEGLHSVCLKCVAFNLPNDHANKSACLDDRAIMAIFETCVIKNT